MKSRGSFKNISDRNTLFRHKKCPLCEFKCKHSGGRKPATNPAGKALPYINTESDKRCFGGADSSAPGPPVLCRGGIYSRRGAPIYVGAGFIPARTNRASWATLEIRTKCILAHDLQYPCEPDSPKCIAQHLLDFLPCANRDHESFFARVFCMFQQTLQFESCVP